MTTQPRYQEQVFARTKIVATVGPASATREVLRDLIEAGVDIFRLNFAHGKHDWLSGIVATIRDLSRELNRTIGLLGDLSGPKIRLGTLPDEGILCRERDEFVFVRGMSTSRPNELNCTYEPLIDDLTVGDRILLADGIVAMRVVEKDTIKGFARCVVEVAGTIRSRQGVNLPGVALSTPCLTEKDREDLAWALKEEIDFLGLSFVRRASDVRLLREAIQASGSQHVPMIVAKIEKPEALDELEAIVDETDAIMVARGDLGVEVDIVKVPGIQKRLIRLCNEKRVPVITATQMLDSMQRNELPTRAEASDVFNAVLDGTDAVMLSGETAAGLYPRQAVTMMSRICDEAERLLPTSRPQSDHAAERRALATTEAVAVGAVATAMSLNADLIAVASVSGLAVLAISKERSRVPVLAVCSKHSVARRLTLLWGVTPIQAALQESDEQTPEHVIVEALEWGRQRGVLQAGSRLVAVASSRWSAEGHDSMLVHVCE